MSRSKPPDDQPDCVVASDDGRQWLVFCSLCPRTLGKGLTRRADAVAYAHEHLEHSHGLMRVWIEQHRPGFRAAVQDAIPGILAHHTQRIDRVRPR